MAKTILVVDDEKDNRSLVKEILKSEGYTMLTAVDGDDCLKQIKEGAKPDLVLMDIMMPGTPAIKIIKKIAPIKVAYLSVVRTSEAEKEELLKSKNIVGFIQKPFDVNELQKKVKALLKR